MNAGTLADAAAAFERVLDELEGIQRRTAQPPAGEGPEAKSRRVRVHDYARLMALLARTALDVAEGRE